MGLDGVSLKSLISKIRHKIRYSVKCMPKIGTQQIRAKKSVYNENLANSEIYTIGL